MSEIAFLYGGVVIWDDDATGANSDRGKQRKYGDH
jgi:hypothetical protein